jgi:hypothetical protein
MDQRIDVGQRDLALGPQSFELSPAIDDAKGSILFDGILYDARIFFPLELTGRVDESSSRRDMIHRGS